MFSCVAAPVLLVCCIDSVSEVILHSVLKLCPVLEPISQGTSMTIHIHSKIFLPVKVLLLSCMLVSTVLDTAMQLSWLLGAVWADVVPVCLLIILMLLRSSLIADYDRWDAIWSARLGAMLKFVFACAV
jgi:hypothetical protein